MLGEIEDLAKKGYNLDGKLFISEKAHIITPEHMERDKKQEEFRTKKVGTTGKGIGPAYTDKISRHGIRFIDFLENENVVESYKDILNQLKPYVANTFDLLHDAVDNKENILFEGAQGTFLDVDHGTYPYVTSSNTVSAGACTGTGIAPNMINKVVGVLKAYTTRVGFGPFPCEQTNEVGNILVQVGKEFGTTTGRKRRCGWLDLFMAEYSRRVNGVTDWVITKLDVLSDFDELLVCTGYKYQGKFLTSFPSSINVLEGVEPVYKAFKGWKCDITQCRTMEDLPKEARTYLKFIEDFTGTPISIVSVGPERNQNIVVNQIWDK
ncbi:adenylosuccinate synthase [bacterium]|nr:MAG: adenylosuccinate synthase [bacterium]